MASADTSFTDISTATGHPYFEGRAINNSGEIVGIDGTGGGIYYPDGSIVAAGGIGSSLSAVNDEGEAVGFVACGERCTHAISWTPNQGVTTLDSFGGNIMYAYGVNNSGEIAGYGTTTTGETDAALWSPSGNLTNLGNLGGGVAQAKGINNQGEVVGLSKTPDGIYHAFKWTAGGGMVELGVLQDGDNSVATAVNNGGEIVGNEYGSNGINEPVYWDAQGTIHDMGPTGLANQYSAGASGINDNGQIVGSVNTLPNHDSYAFIWSPNSGYTTLPGYFNTPRNGGGPTSTGAGGINNNSEVLGGSINPTTFLSDTLIWMTAEPSAPTNLTASSPAQYPSLSWDAVSGATFYNVYRNGSLLDTISSDNTSYIDSTAPLGSNDYYVTAVNAGGESDPSNTVTVNVVDPTPVVGSISAPTTIAKDVSLNASASFTYPLTGDTHTATWNWGDGNSSNGTVTESNGSGSVTGSHTYTTAGSYTVTLTVTDENGNSATSQTTVAVSPLANGSFQNAHIGGLNFDNANFSNVNLWNVQGNNASFQNVNFTGANLQNAQLKTANLTGANFTNANLHNAHLDGATLTNATWSNTTCPDNTNSDSHGMTCVGHGGGL